jgi:hypothetical protein
MAERSEEIYSAILADIEKGITLAEICRREGMPNRCTVYDWLKEDEHFGQRFARARELGFDAIAEQCIEIAEDGSNDWMLRRREDGSTVEVLNSEHVQRSKLRIETRLKLLSKWYPKRFGEKLDVEHKGGVTVTMGDLDEKI